jgi:hypothetical protein
LITPRPEREYRDLRRHPQAHGESERAQPAMLDTLPQPLYTRPDIPVRTVAVRREGVAMNAPHAAGWSRRAFLGGLTLAAATGLRGLYSRTVSAEPPLDTTTIM